MMNVKTEGLLMVDNRVRLIINMIRLNRLLGYEKFDITDELLILNDLVGEYGIGNAPIHDMNLMVLEDIKEKLESIG
nr:hypothetical protein 14 [Bacillaceae bacterium]